METFFFVPGTRLHKIADIESLGVSQIIIDLEDAVKFSERAAILEQLKSNPEYKRHYIRIPFYNEKGELMPFVFRDLYEQGFRNFVVPKIQKAADFDQIMTAEKYEDLRLILLVETTRFFIEVKDILLKYENLFSGIGIGSHDFMAEVGGVHDLKNLEYARIQILYLARMIDVQAVDIACMELKDENYLKEEITDGLQKGYDAKFFIHPWQIKIFKSLSLYAEEDLEWAKKVKSQLDRVGTAGEFNPIVLDGKIIERPHLIKAEKIIKYYETK